MCARGRMCIVLLRACEQNGSVKPLSEQKPQAIAHISLCHGPLKLSAGNMLQWANKRPFLRCLHARVSVIKETRLWLDACVQSFMSPFASKASSCDAITTLVKQVSRRNSKSNLGDAQSKVHRQHAHGRVSAGGDAKVSVRNAGRQDINVQFCNGNVKASQQDAKGHSVDGDVKGFDSSTCKLYAKMHSSNGDARVTETVACGKIQSLDSCSPSIWDSRSELALNDDTILASSAKFKDKCLPSDVSNASGETLSLHASLQTLVIQTQKKSPKATTDLQQKIDHLESEQVSLSDAARLVKRRAFQSCSFEQLSTVLQVLKEIFPSAKVVHDIVVGSSSILLEPAELVQQKLKLLYDFQVEAKVVSRLCTSGKVLSLSVELLQRKLMFYKDVGLTVEAMNMMFTRGPLILLYSLERSIQPTLNFLESIGLTRDSIWHLAQHCPQVFYMSIDNNLTKRYEYFRQLGFSAKDFSRACHCLSRCPMKSIEEHMQYLKDRGFTDDDVVLMVKKKPSILSRSLENIKCKLDFLIFEQKRDMAEIVNDPACLTLSLQRRMVPRFNLIKELGDSKVYSLAYILRPSESIFMERFGRQKESGFSATS